MKTYEVDTLVRLSATFASAAGTPIDPTEVILFVLTPDNPTGVATEYTEIVRDAEGAYHYDYLPAAAGYYTYKWQGTGDAEVTSPDTRFLVNRTRFTVEA